MCGIMGFVRTGEDSNLTLPTISKTLDKISTRGKDASGFGLRYNNQKAVVWKHFLDSSELIKRDDYWEILNQAPVNLFIGHARAATHGTEFKNYNNHPHYTEDGKLMLVHNGVINSTGFAVKEKLTSDCDSEILLRYLEEFGLEEGYLKLTNDLYGTYAVLVLDNSDNSIYFFRDSSSPLSYTDLTNSIGGYLFASTENIVLDSLVDSLQVDRSVKKALVHEVTPRILYRITPFGSIEEIKRAPPKVINSHQRGGYWKGGVHYQGGSRKPDWTNSKELDYLNPEDSILLSHGWVHDKKTGEYRYSPQSN
jgi:asparagine synthetase B (glutamine-hydrolysing)